MKPSEVIDKALTDVLTGPEKWTKGGLERLGDDGDVTYCMAGAMMRAVSTNCLEGLTSAQPEETDRFRLYQAALGGVNGVLADSYQYYGGVAGFNDKPERTFDEVREVLEKARAQMQEKGE